MSSVSAPIYPAYTFRASPTYFAWVKITATDIYALREERGFEGQHLYFHLNHPIRFVSLVAPIVQIEDLFGKFTLLRLDDGSGATISVKITRLPPDISQAVECPSNTTVDNLNVISKLGTYNVVVDSTVLDIGTVVKVKCTISDWKKNRQLELKRIRVIKSTEEEVQAWEEVVRWKKDVLGSPWVLSKPQIRDIDAQEAEARRKRKEHDKAKEEREKQRMLKKAKRAEKMKKYEERYERKRKQEEMEMNAGSLPGSNWITWPP